MAYNDIEQDIIKAGIESGKSKDEIKNALIKYRSGYVPPAPVVAQAEKPLANKITNALGLGKAVDTFGSLHAINKATEDERQYIDTPTGKQLAGAALQTGAVALSPAIAGGGTVLGQVAAGAGLGYLFDAGSDLVDNKSSKEVLTPGTGTAIGAVVPPALRGAGALAKGATGLIGTAARTVADNIPSIPTGAGQMVKEYAERIPRAIGKGAESIENARIRSERIANATPEVQQAIKSGLDDVMIGAVEQADEPTKAAYRKMIEIAESPRNGLRPASRPESVAGEAASEQYKILDKQRQTVGSQIGEAVDKLTATKGKVDTLPAQRQMRDVLRQNGILPDVSGQLQFQGTKYTPAQRQAIQKLYELATEGGETLTPRQIYNKDQLFSQLQREARFSEVGDIIIDVPEGSMSLFRAFRNIYANHLDEIAPEIKGLNSQYRKLKNLQDDVESSIVKSGNFETTKGIDPSEFAQTNLRRLFSDAQSAADYRKIYENLDVISRGLGYTGPRADDLAGFAQRLRQVYPETTPETSFSGGISGGIMNALGKVFNAGAPDVTDQQKALRAMLGIKGESSKIAPAAIAGLPSVDDEDSDVSESLGLLGLGGLLSKRQGSKEAWKIVKALSKERARLVKSTTKNPDKNKSIQSMLESIDSSIRMYSRELF